MCGMVGCVDVGIDWAGGMISIFFFLIPFYLSPDTSMVFIHTLYIYLLLVISFSLGNLYNTSNLCSRTR